jgi:serine/threonine-protein kinase
MNKELAANATLSHYRIVSKIGAGGMGEVYQAQDTRLDRRVALKILPENFAGDAERMRRFEQEAKAASALNHPNILTIHEIGEGDGKHYIATEYIEGETMRHHIVHSRMKAREVLDILVQVASALAAAHQAGIIHRDIKPENIMLRPDGYVKVLDFGLAKLTQKQRLTTDSDAATISRKETDPGTVMGTVQYMSPEQARGKEVDARTDIFSLGIVLYELVAGRAPFAGESSTDVLAAILDKDPPPLARYADDIPQELQRIATKCLRKDRDERYQTMKDVLLDLKELRDELALEAKLERSIRPASNSAAEHQQTLIAEAEISRGQSVQATSAASAQTTSSAEYIVSEIKNHKRGFAIVMLVLLVAAIGLAYWFFFLRAGSKQIESIAVLPFENASGNPVLDYLSDGISESVIDRLSQLPQLKVIARSSSFRYRGQSLDLKQIAGALGVDAIVTGRVVPRGDNYQIRVDVTDVRENKQFWGENFTRNASDVQVLQTDISREIAENLRLRLSGTETRQLTAQGTTNSQAYELRLKGRYYFNKFSSPEDFHKSVEYYEQAVGVDPNYALAWAELAESYEFGGGRGLDRNERRSRREAAARKSLDMDPSLAEAHFALANLKRDSWEWEEAEREYRRTIELNPSLSGPHGAYAALLSYLKRFDEAITESERRNELDPLSPLGNTASGDVYFRARRYDEAIGFYKRVLELNPATPVAHQRLGDAYTAQGKYTEAIAAYQKALSLRSGDDYPYIEAMLGTAYARGGERERAEEILQKLKTGGYARPRVLAILYAALGNKDEAFAQLEKAFATRDAGLRTIAVEPYFDDLRGDQRFGDLLRRLNLP